MPDQPQPLAGAAFRNAYRKALATRGRQQRNKRGKRAAAKPSGYRFSPADAGQPGPSWRPGRR